MKNFNWNRLKNQKIAICVRTGIEDIDFRNECDKQSITWFDGTKASLRTGLEEDDDYEICYVYEQNNATNNQGILAYPLLECKLQNIKIVYWTDYCKNKKFTKNDLKPFMLVITRNGDRFIITKNLLIDKNNVWNRLSDYDNDLKMIGPAHRNQFNIMSVYVPRDETLSLSFSLFDRVCVWERG